MATQPQHQRPGGNGRDPRDPREIQHDIERTRSEMDHTLDELSHRLHPRHLLDIAYDYFRSSAPVSRGDLTHSARSAGKSVVRQIRRHPVPAVLIGAGIAYAIFMEEDEEERDVHAQWADIPEYSGSFVDARTGEPYDPETYGAEWRQEAAAWHPAFDWSRSEVSEEKWNERAKHSLDSIRATLADTGRSARDKMRHVASQVVGLSGHRREEVHSRWANLRSHGGSWEDLQTGQPYDQERAREWEALMACDYCATADWTEEEEQSWSEKAQHALEEMQQSLADSSRGAKEQVRALAAKVGEFVGGTRDWSAHAGRSAYARAGRAAAGMRRGAARAGREVGRGARSLGRRTRRGGARMGRQVREGYAYSRHALSEAMDDYPLAAGAAFLGLGLLLGFALPRSEYEDRMMGETSDEFKHAAKETSREAAERARHVAQATAGAAMEEAERQGLTPRQAAEKAQRAASEIKHTIQEETAGADVHTVADKAAAVAQRAAHTAKEEAQKEARDMSS